MAEDAKKIKVGSGMDLSTKMGSLISDEQQRRVLSYLESGLFEGAKAVVGGRKSGDKGYFVEPTVSVAISNRDGAVKWATMCWNSILK